MILFQSKVGTYREAQRAGMKNRLKIMEGTGDYFE